MSLVLSHATALLVKKAIQMSLLQLIDLDVLSGSLICTIVLLRLVLGVPIGLTSRQINAILYRTSFSLMLGWSWCLRLITFDELAKAPPQIVSSSY